MVDGLPRGLMQSNGLPGVEGVLGLGGGVMINRMAPVGCAVPSPATPVTVAVSVVLPPSVGLADATRVTSGVCSARVTVLAVEEDGR